MVRRKDSSSVISTQNLLLINLKNLSPFVVTFFSLIVHVTESPDSLEEYNSL